VFDQIKFKSDNNKISIKKPLVGKWS